MGILSFGSDQCGAAGVPSVYTDIKKYVTWIRDNIPVIYDNWVNIYSVKLDINQRNK